MATVYRKLCSLCALHKIPEQVKLENPTLHSVMEHTTSYKKIIKGLENDNRALGRNHCDYCDHQPMDLHCKRYVLVTERDTEGLEKKLLHTFKDPNEIPLVYGVLHLCQLTKVLLTSAIGSNPSYG